MRQRKQGAPAGAQVEGVENLHHAQRQECHRHAGGRLSDSPHAVLNAISREITQNRQSADNTAFQNHVKAKAAGENTFLRAARRPVHGIALRFLHSKGNCREGIGDQVDPENVDRPEDREAQQGRDKYSQNLSQVGGKQELDRLADIVIDSPAFRDRGDDRREIVIGEDHVRDRLGNVRTRNSHAHADIRALDGRGVIYAVAGHGRYATEGLPGVHDPDLILRLYPGVYTVFADIVGKYLIRNGVKLGACNRHLPFFQDAQFFRDGYRGIFVVAGDHDRADSGAAAFFNSRLYFRTDRVDHAAHADPDQILLKLKGFVRGRRLFMQLRGGAQDTQGTVRHPLILSQNLGTLFLCQGDDLPFLQNLRAAVQHFIRGALGKLQITGPLPGSAGKCRRNNFFRSFMDGRHPLADGIKRRFVHAGQLFFQLRFGKPVPVRVIDQRAFRRFADCLAFFQLGVRAQGHGGHQKSLIVAHMLDNRHLILRERTGLVRADDLRAAQRLYGGKLSDDRIVLRHLCHADGQKDRNDSGKALRNRSNRKGNSDHEGIEYGSAAVSDQIDQENESTDQQNHNRQLPAEFLQLQLERRFFIARA